jgi:hypothetical protein
MPTRRAWCVERRSPRSTEAHRRNPRWVPPERRRSAPESNPDVLSDGWEVRGRVVVSTLGRTALPARGHGPPNVKAVQACRIVRAAARCPVETGRQGKTSRRSKPQEAVINEAGANPARGARAHEVRPTRLAWGASDLATGGTDSLTGVGDRGQISRPRKAQLQKAREGLPVTSIGDGAGPRIPHTEG